MLVTGIKEASRSFAFIRWLRDYVPDTRCIVAKRAVKPNSGLSNPSFYGKVSFSFAGSHSIRGLSKDKMMNEHQATYRAVDALSG